ncbi:hypothetical protein [Candidatus Aalborgicola defluviihabitans]
MMSARAGVLSNRPWMPCRTLVITTGRTHAASKTTAAQQAATL